MNQQERCLWLIKALLKDMLHYEDKERLPSGGWEVSLYSAVSYLLGSFQFLFGSSLEKEANSAQTSVR